MKKIATEDEWILKQKAPLIPDAHLPSAIPVGEERQSNEVFETGTDQDYEIQLNSFLSLAIYRCQIQQDTYWDSVLPSRSLQERVSLNFCLTGRFRTHLQDLVDEHWEVPGFNYTEYISGVREIEFWPAEEPILRLRLCLTPHGLAEIGLDRALPPLLWNFIEKGTLQPFYYLEQTTPAMQWVLDQILNCHFTGSAKRLYWEGKALELLALKIHQWASQYGCPPDSRRIPSRLKAEDIERIHQAREILLQKIQDPPSLVKLAHLVGINDRKLKEGFREVFGTTVFGYLHDYRMTQARQLLLENRWSVQQVAHAVGYRSLSSFSGAFKVQFGLPPKMFLKQGQ